MFEDHPIRKTLERWTTELPGSRWFVVGGAVRDALLQCPVKDLDVLVAGVPFDVLMPFLEARGSVSPVGRAFGVLKFVGKEDGMMLDIALPRRERSAGTGGYRDVEARTDPSMPIEEDLGRRDFTINAMAWEAKQDRLIDPFGGWEDLRKSILRAVGEASRRFSEDYTRLLRALRFAAQLRFEIEPETWKALLACMPQLNQERDGQRLVPYEIVARELLKGFEADPVRTAHLWQEACALPLVMPELADWPVRVQAALERLKEEDACRILGTAQPPMAVVFGLSTAHLGVRPAAALADRLKLASAGTGVDAALLARLATGHVALYKELGLKPVLGGADIMRLLGLPAGPPVGEMLDRLLDAQAKGKVSGPQEAEAFLKKSL